MTDPKLHELLDQTQFGDRLTLAHSNGKHTASISGPVLTDQTHDPAVGIHLLDGDPHIVRTSTGVSQGETGHEDQYETDFDRWLDSLSPGQREQITRDIEAARDLIRAEAWDEGYNAGVEPKQLGGSDFMAWMADRLADPEVRAGYLAAHEREVRAQIASELIPVVAHKGPNDTDLSLLDEAAHKLEHGYSFGSNVTAAVVRLIRNAIHIARKEQP